MADTTVLWIAIGLILFGIALEACHRWANRPLTETDYRLSRVDQEIDDELAARRATRPHGNVEVGPWDRDGARVQFSDVGDPEAWTAANWVDLWPDDATP